MGSALPGFQLGVVRDAAPTVENRKHTWGTVTWQRSNQLNYVPTRQINEMRNNQCLCAFARFAYIASFALTDPDCS